MSESGRVLTPLVTVGRGATPEVKCSECGCLGSDMVPIYDRADAERLAEQHRAWHVTAPARAHTEVKS